MFCILATLNIDAENISHWQVRTTAFCGKVCKFHMKFNVKFNRSPQQITDIFAVESQIKENH